MPDTTLHCPSPAGPGGDSLGAAAAGVWVQILLQSRLSCTISGKASVPSLKNPEANAPARGNSEGQSEGVKGLAQCLPRNEYSANMSQDRKSVTPDAKQGLIIDAQRSLFSSL